MLLNIDQPKTDFTNSCGCPVLTGTNKPDYQGTVTRLFLRQPLPSINALTEIAALDIEEQNTQKLEGEPFTTVLPTGQVVDYSEGHRSQCFNCLAPTPVSELTRDAYYGEWCCEKCCAEIGASEAVTGAK